MNSIFEFFCELEDIRGEFFPLKMLVYVDSSTQYMRVGTRVLGTVEEEETLLPGTIAEPKSLDNNSRYLVFFDNGLERYLEDTALHEFCDSSQDPADDVPESTETPWIRNYISQYPDNPKCEVSLGQKVKVYEMGKWLPAEVTALDCSLVEVKFTTKEVERWIYQGSRYLLPNEIPDLVPLLSHKLSPFKHKPIQRWYSPFFIPHICSSDCLDEDFENKHLTISHFKNPLSVGWKRYIMDDFEGGTKSVLYLAPCDKTFRTIKAVCRYLEQTGSKLEIDNFTFSSKVDVMAQYKFKSRILLPDFSFGKEKIPISVINEVDKTFPPFTEYITIRQLEIEIETFNHSCGCDCTDNCKDPKKCQCQIMSLDACKMLNKNVTTFPGYKHRRLNSKILSGIYECNSSCRCQMSCTNRVVQNGITFQLQLFKTLKCGWGVRTLEDIPCGAFICTYAGMVLSDYEAECPTKAGKFKDMYYADLDYIDIMKSQMENQKEASLNHSVIENSENSPTEEDTLCNEVDEHPKKENFASLWQCYKDMDTLLLDSKNCGNIGKFLNHSCEPNLFAQCVFVESYDLRLPTFSFFSLKDIASGSELTWDYGYSPIEGREILCQCGSKNCRGRLL